MAVLIGASVLLVSGGILAQKSKTASASIEWQKGKRLAPTRRETYKLATGTTVTANPASALEVQSKVPLPTSIDGLAPFAHAAQLTTGRMPVGTRRNATERDAPQRHAPERVGTRPLMRGPMNHCANPDQNVAGCREAESSGGGNEPRANRAVQTK